MPMPTDIGVIDLMIGFPEADRRHYYDFLRANLRDHESLDEFEFPAQYMFKNVPKVEAQSDPVKGLLDLMDKHLEGRKWFVADQFSLADICLFAYTHVADEANFDLEAYPEIVRWMERIMTMDGHVGLDD